VTESLGLRYTRDRYVIVLDDQERRWAREDRRVAGVGDNEVLVGWNTGCAPRYPYKKLLVEDQVALLRKAWGHLQRKDRIRFALLGGGLDDEHRNHEIAAELESDRIPVVRLPCTHGLRRGLASMAACDMVVSGDTLGLHMAIGLKKPVVAWFGITCHQEIDVYGRGIKVLSTVRCRPCWLQSCELEPKCYRELPWEPMAAAISEMATTLLRDGSWAGERIIGEFPPKNRISPPLGVSPGPVL
jgi:heptosyltransferase-2